MASKWLKFGTITQNHLKTICIMILRGQNTFWVVWTWKTKLTHAKPLCGPIYREEFAKNHYQELKYSLLYVSEICFRRELSRLFVLWGCQMYNVHWPYDLFVLRESNRIISDMLTSTTQQSQSELGDRLIESATQLSFINGRSKPICIIDTFVSKTSLLWN